MRSIHICATCICLLFFTGCSSTNAPDLAQLPGYWEIEAVHAYGEVFAPKGAAPAVDFYHLKADSIGYKKKMAPTFNALYQSSEDQIAFSVLKEGQRFYLHFDSALIPWKEEILSINAEQMVLFHNDKEYHYKRHQKITL